MFFITKLLEIKAADTFSSPQYFEKDSDDKVLKRFDFAVVNPPFSLKNWTDGLRDYGRFDGFGAKPPEKMQTLHGLCI